MDSHVMFQNWRSFSKPHYGLQLQQLELVRCRITPVLPFHHLEPDYGEKPESCANGQLFWTQWRQFKEHCKRPCIDQQPRYTNGDTNDQHDQVILIPYSGQQRIVERAVDQRKKYIGND